MACFKAHRYRWGNQPSSDLLTSSDKIAASDATHQCSDAEGKVRERGYGEEKQQVGTRPVDKRGL